MIITVGYFIIYISIVNLYTIHVFNLPQSVINYANNIFKDKKNVHSSRRSFKPNRSFKKASSNKEGFLNFEKKHKQNKKQTKEHNRFTDDDEFNRFEDTKF